MSAHGHTIRDGSSHAGARHDRPYAHLVVMLLLSFLAMYALMYSMVNGSENVYFNLNNVYMAGLMAAPMAIFELIVMRAMYRDRRLNAAVWISSVVVLVAFWGMIRQQTAIGDKEFLRSMIPHHSGAILMCREARIQDNEIRELCKTIIASQQAEIDQMTAALTRLDR